MGRYWLIFLGSFVFARIVCGFLIAGFGGFEFGGFWGLGYGVGVYVTTLRLI